MKLYRQLSIIVLALFVIACNEKKQDILPSLKTEPGNGSRWTYRYTEYNNDGSILTRYDVTYRAFLKSINGKKWMVLQDTLNNVYRTMQKRDDGYYALFGDREELLFKYPAMKNDSYFVYMPDSSLQRYKVVSTESYINVPAGSFKGCYFYERYNDSNHKKEEVLFTKDRWIIRIIAFEEAKLGRYQSHTYELLRYEP